MCSTRHRSWNMTARCQYPRAARVSGEGRCAVWLPSMRGGDIELHASQRDALRLWMEYRRLGARWLILAPHGRRR